MIFNLNYVLHHKYEHEFLLCIIFQHPSETITIDKACEGWRHNRLLLSFGWDWYGRRTSTTSRNDIALVESRFWQAVQHELRNFPFWFCLPIANYIFTYRTCFILTHISWPTIISVGPGSVNHPMIYFEGA